MFASRLPLKRIWMNILVIVSMLAVSIPAAQAAPPSGSDCQTTSPANGANVTGTVTVSGTYTKAYQVVVAFNAGTIYDAHMTTPTGNDTGTWTYSWNPSSPTKYSGNVEITVRCFSIDDRYFRWGTPVNVTVNIAANQPPTASIVSPAEGTSVSGTVPVTVSASDAQGLSSVEVRVDWGAWQAATLSGGNYIYNWAAPAGNKTHSIEARATDTNGNVTTTLTKYVKTGTGTNEAPALKQTERAIWLWEPAAYQLLENAGARNVLAQFMDDTSVSTHLRKTIYFFADQYDGGYMLKDNPAAYRSFISWAHGRGYYVHALLASSFYMAPMWAYSRYHNNAVGLMENVLNYNISSAANEQFDGVNIDIEPHGLPEWPTKPIVQVQYLDMVKKMMDRKTAAGQNLNVGPAIPRWLDENSECQNITWNGATKWCENHVADITDYVAIMDYRDVATGPSGIIDHASGEIAYGDSIGKKVVIGVETDQISASGDPETISFQEEGRNWMESELNQVYSTYGSHASFLGMAIHHYDSYKVLPTAWTPTGTRWQTTVADSANPGTPGSLTAAAWDWQRLDLHWTRSTDDVQVDYYEVHRSTTNGFTPSPSTLVRTTNFNFVKDWGLVPSTTYYYKVIAVDVAGHKSTASAQASAATPAGVGLNPLHIASITFSDGNSTSTATLKVVNASGVAISGANIFGHWEGAAGKKFSNNSGTGGTISTSTESLTAPYTVIFVPEKILASGYYWAYSQDVVHSATWNRN